jgi:transcriptional regulator GlxA family with amidase domain
MKGKIIRMVQPIQIKPYTLKELAILYGVDSRTFKTWLEPFKKDIGQKIGRYYMIAQVKVIFEKLDLPCYADAA